MHRRHKVSCTELNKRKSPNMATNGICRHASWLFLLAGSIPNGSSAFLMPNSQPAAMLRAPLILAAKNHESPLRLAMNEKSTDTPSKDVDPIAKAAWYGVEAFGKVFGSKKPEEEMESVVNLERKPQSLQETQTRIKEDFDRAYFLSGEVDALIYDEQCTFRFVSLSLIIFFLTLTRDSRSSLVFQ